MSTNIISTYARATRNHCFNLDHIRLGCFRNVWNGILSLGLIQIPRIEENFEFLKQGVADVSIATCRILVHTTPGTEALTFTTFHYAKFARRLTDLYFL